MLWVPEGFQNVPESCDYSMMSARFFAAPALAMSVYNPQRFAVSCILAFHIHRDAPV
jgi:hypothetical protein